MCKWQAQRQRFGQPQQRPHLVLQHLHEGHEGAGEGEQRARKLRVQLRVVTRGVHARCGNVEASLCLPPLSVRKVVG
jgi:hypothetical protein